MLELLSLEYKKVCEQRLHHIILNCKYIIIFLLLLCNANYICMRCIICITERGNYKNMTTIIRQTKGIIKEQFFMAGCEYRNDHEVDDYDIIEEVNYNANFYVL